MTFRAPPEHVGFLIGDVSRILRIVYDRRVEPLGLTRAQWRVLARFSRSEGSTQTELAALLEIEKPTLGRLLDRLQKKDWIERRSDEKDARTKRLFLTKRALPLLEEMYEIADQVLGAAIAGLSKQQADNLHELLLRVKGNLSKTLNKNNDTKTKPH